MINVLVVEDQSMARALFEMYVKSDSKYSLLASVSSADLAMYYCDNASVDLILMDICTYGVANGLTAAEEIKKKYPEIKVIIVTSMPEYSYLPRARKIGVDSFWYKEVSNDSILDIMDRTMNGEHVFPDTTPEIKLGVALSGSFTGRELDVLKELTTGNTNAEIGRHLNMSAGTVKTHIQHLLAKTGFTTRTELAVKARQSGLTIKD